MSLRFYHLCFFAVLGLPMLVSCQNHEPRSILEKAIAAHGGEANINKPRMGFLKAATKSLRDQGTQEETFDLPKRWKRVTMTETEDSKKTVFNLMKDKKIWVWEDTAEPQQVRNPGANRTHIDGLRVLLDLKGENIKLALLPTKKVDGKSAIGFRATWDGGGPADYYFDATTNLLVESKSQWRPVPGKEATLKQVFGDFREFDGLRIPYRRTMYIKNEVFKDYVLLQEIIVSELRILDKLPDDAFAFPQKK